MDNRSFPVEKSFFDHALSSVTVLQLQHACESHTIKPEEMTFREMKAKIKIILILFILKNRMKENL